MANYPTGRNGKVLAASLALLALLIAWLGFVAPVLDWYDGRSARLADMQARIGREWALVMSLPALKKEAAAAAQTPARAALTGSTDAIAGAALQEQVQQLAGAASAQLTSVETLPADQVGLYRRIGVRVELNAPLGVVVALLKSIEEAQPSMLVDELHLTGGGVNGSTAPLPLDSSFTVYGFRVGTAKDNDQ
jgi:general secretion pathway protein M